MPSINAHTYSTESAANYAVSVINAGEGIGTQPGQETDTYAVPQWDVRGFWWIYADDVTAKYYPAPGLVSFPDPEPLEL